MAITSNAPEADEQVLSTLNRDGSRRWIRPKLSTGRFYRWRLATAARCAPASAGVTGATAAPARAANSSRLMSQVTARPAARK